MPDSSPLLTYLQLMRLPNSFTAASNILAAQLLVTQGTLEWKPLLLLIAASVFLYSGGIVLNDCFDYEEDRRERPSRPLPAGRIALANAWLLGALLLLAGTLFALLVGTKQFAIAVTIITLILLYDGYAKHTAAGSLVMGLCRYGNWLLGLSFGGDDANAWLFAMPILLYVTSLTILSKAETGAERRIPILLCASGLVLTAVVIVGLHLLGLLPQRWALILLGAAFLLISQRLWVTFQSFTAQHVQHAVKTLVLGIIPLDAILVFAGGPWWGGLLVLALIVPSALMARIMYVT